MPYVLKCPRLWYERCGRGDPLLMITGFAISAAVFEPVLPLYARHFDCITYDNRGAGRSASTAWPISVPQLAGDAARLLDALGIESAHIVGVSMGGMIAQELAIRFPERVRGLILAATTPGGPRAVRPTLGELAALAGQTVGALRLPGRPWLAAGLFSESFRREHPDQVVELLAYFSRHRARPWGLTGHWWATVYHDTISRLHRIQAPTLVMHGERDVLSPMANARMLVAGIPDAELAIVPGAGHAFALERPEQSLDLALRWFRTREPIRAGSAPGGLSAKAEPLTRTLGLPVGALRTGASLLRRGGRPQTKSVPEQEGLNVAVDRRAA